MARKNPTEEPAAVPAKAGKPSALLDTCVLRPTGSFYYHCDWHASHYVKVMLEELRWGNASWN